MKVCPYCDGISEENNAIKCNICGHSLENIQEYSIDELNDEVILEEIRRENSRIRNKPKRIKAAIVVLGLIIVGIIISITIILEPSGHLEIKQSYYETSIGQEIVIEPMYSSKISSKHVRIDIVSSNYDKKEISFRYKIENEKFIIEPIKEDNLILEFYVKDDGNQKDYNNTVNIVITNMEG